MGFLSVNHKKCMVITLIIAVAISLLACDPYANKYPFKEEGPWICKDPEFTISYSKEPNNGIIEESTLEWDGETIHVDVTFQVDTYCVIPFGTTAHADRLFNGTWEYRGKDLVFYIEEDFLFDGHFYELVFSKVSCNP